MTDIELFLQMAPESFKREVYLIQNNTKIAGRTRRKALSRLFAKEARKHGGKQAECEMMDICNEAMGC